MFCCGKKCYRVERDLVQVPAPSVNVKKRTAKKAQGVRKMSCGYLLDILPYIMSGWLTENQTMVEAYYSCIMLG